MRDCDVAQAVELVRALQQQLHEMTTRLARVERQRVSGSSHLARALRLEAAALRRDITEAQVHIERLERHYLGLNGSQAAGRVASARPRTGLRRLPPTARAAGAVGI